MRVAVPTRADQVGPQPIATSTGRHHDQANKLPERQRQALHPGCGHSRRRAALPGLRAHRPSRQFHGDGGRRQEPLPRHAPRGPHLSDHSDRDALPTDPLRHPGDRREDLSRQGRRPREEQTVPRRGLLPQPTKGHHPGHDGMLRQRPSEPAVALVGTRTLEPRRDRDRRVDGHAAARGTRGGRPSR
jgi:hypothetical protein